MRRVSTSESLSISNLFLSFLERGQKSGMGIALLFLYYLLCTVQIHSQTFKVEGSVFAADTIPVKYAEVTFTFADDTTQKFSTLTDSSGNYNLDIIVTSLGDDGPATPTSFELAQNYPNPFLTETAILFKLNEHSNVSLVIYDILGQEVRRFNIGEKLSGVHGITWDGRNNFNLRVAPGVYIYQLLNGKEKLTKKMVYGMGETKIPEINLSFYNDLRKNDNVYKDDLIFTVEIKNSDSTKPKIYSQISESITIQDDIILNFIVEKIDIITLNIQGNITTISEPVRYVEVTVVNASDTTKKFSAITDSSGNYGLSISTYADELVFNAGIESTDSTQPDIYSNIYGDILIQRDTTLNFVLEAVTGPWTKVKRGLEGWLWDINFPDSINGWAVGFYGVILHSNDKGESWQEQISPVEEILSAVDFIDSSNGWICGQSSILKTTNGGKSWNVKYSENLNEGSFRDIQFLNKQIGFAVGGRDFLSFTPILLSTIDGGETWQDVTPQGLSTLTHISIVDENNIWISGYGGVILFSADLGLTWTIKSINVNAYWFNTIQFVDQYNGWIGCDDDDSYLRQFLRTTDGGNTWEPVPTETYPPLGSGVHAIFFVDSLNGWLAPVIGFAPRSIVNTTDGGQTWELLPEGIELGSVKSFSFINKNLGWAVGTERLNGVSMGVILRYKKPQ
jgi:photosystem II stability/assembly factor-like uncharacterized protein